MADVVEFRQCDRRNYTPGRRGQSVRRVVVHYTGTSASAHNNLLYFSRSAAGASAHYFIGKSGDVRQSVLEKDTAWHAGNWQMNLMSVGIEVVSAGEDFTQEQVRSLARLVGDLMARYRLRPADVIRHYDVTGKLCPAPYVGAAKWGALRAAITGGASAKPAAPAPAPGPSGDTDALARDVLAGRYGDGEERRRALGSRYEAVQARVNELVGEAEPPRARADVDALARAVIRGEYGNGAARRAALGADYEAVQARVNELLR